MTAVVEAAVVVVATVVADVVDFLGAVTVVVAVVLVADMVRAEAADVGVGGSKAADSRFEHPDFEPLSVSPSSLSITAEQPTHFSPSQTRRFFSRKTRVSIQLFQASFVVLGEIVFLGNKHLFIEPLKLNLCKCHHIS